MSKWAPNCAADARVRASAAQLGTHFGLNWGQEGGVKNLRKPIKSRFMLTHPKQPKKTTTSAKPKFSGPEPGFGPDAVVLGCFEKGLHQNFHIWPKPRFSGPEPGCWARCGHLGLFCKGGAKFGFWVLLMGGVSLAIRVLLMSG